MSIPFMRRGDEQQRSYRLRTDVYFDYQQDDIAVLMDMRRGQFFALDEFAVEYLQRLLKSGFEATCQQMSGRFGQPIDRMRQDLRRLVERLLHHGLLEYAQPHQPRLPHCTFSNFGKMVLVWCALRVVGWSRTLSMIRFLTGRSMQSSSHSTVSRAEATASVLTVLDQTDRVVHGIGQRIWLNVACKEKAILCWWLLAEANVNSAIVVGYRTDPFLAHTWVEALGRTLTDDEINCRCFSPIATFPLQPV